MRILFVFRSCPGPLGFLAASLAKEHDVFFAAETTRSCLPGVQHFVVASARKKSTNPLEEFAKHGQRALHEFQNLVASGFQPDCIIASASPIALHLRTLWPETLLIAYTERDLESIPFNAAGIAQVFLETRLLSESNVILSTSCPTPRSIALETRFRHVVHLARCVDTELFRPQPKGKPFKVIFTNLAENTDFFHQTVQFLKAMPTASAFVLCDSLKSQQTLLAAKEELGLSNLAIYHSLKQSDYLSLLSQADVLVSSSSIQRRSSILFEAMSCGVVPIVSDQVLSPPLVHQQTALMCPSKDICAYLLALAQSSSLRRLQKQARAAMVNHYDLRLLLPQYLQVLNNIFSSHIAHSSSKES